MASTAERMSKAVKPAASLSRRDKQKSQTRGRLIRAAMKVFAREGYSGASVDSIAAEADTGRSTFYLHFGSKADVIRAVFVDLEPEAIEKWRRLDAIRDPTAADVRQWLEETNEGWVHHREEMSAMFQAIAVDPLLLQLHQEGVARVADAMVNYLARYPADQRKKAHMRMIFLILQQEQIQYFRAMRGIKSDQELAYTVLAELFAVAFAPNTKIAL